LEQGSSIFFGSLLEASHYFSSLGYQCPKSITPTDYYLQITDSNFHSEKSENLSLPDNVEDDHFKTKWNDSDNYFTLKDALNRHEDFCQNMNQHQMSVLKVAVPFWRQVSVLIYREYMIAYRDPTLYYLQAILFILFSSLTGAVLWMLPTDVNGNSNLLASGILWLVFFHTWVHAFKVFHLSASDKRAQHEVYNGKYPVLAVLVADIVSVSSLVLFLPASSSYPLLYDGIPSRSLPIYDPCLLGHLSRRRGDGRSCHQILIQSNNLHGLLPGFPGEPPGIYWWCLLAMEGLSRLLGLASRDNNLCSGI
jgi:hypothetical protein